MGRSGGDSISDCMYYAYVLKSQNFDFLYKGHCEHLTERLKQHNSGLTKSIKAYAPFDLIYKRSLKHEMQQLKEKSISKLLLEEDI